MLRNKALPDDLHDREWDQDADESPMLNLKIGKVSLMKFRQSVFCTKSTPVSNLFDIITKLHHFTLIFFSPSLFDTKYFAVTGDRTGVPLIQVPLKRSLCQLSTCRVFR